MSDHKTTKELTFTNENELEAFSRMLASSEDWVLRLTLALREIRDMPMSEQDNMLSAHMRNIARDILSNYNTSQDGWLTFAGRVDQGTELETILVPEGIPTQRWHLAPEDVRVIHGRVFLREGSSVKAITYAE
jgi:hypothetical protein